MSAADFFPPYAILKTKQTYQKNTLVYIRLIRQ
jgi:hypothetical protein